ncbi:MAG: hypothetical protein LBG99_06950 [Propionibacteriaceae bacterium]|jgi:tetratricopeptide (TPR) repeat protein|nr:hypothetical protein [Propionibacteriaceae bacterium]
MSDPRQEIKDLLEKIDETYWGPEERAMIDRALELSRELGDEELEYQVRVRLTASAVRTGDSDALLSSFAWCLAKHDEDPQRFPTDVENGAADLMWQFKWMIGALDDSPIFSLTQGEAMLDDMEAHYVREGLGLSGVITARFQHAWGIGDIEKAKELRTLLAATPRDEHSHCDACGRSELAGFALEIGEEEHALTLVDEIMEGGFSCGEEPEHALSRTLVAKLKAGRNDDALDSHMRSYRLARNNPDNISIVADNMIFCAITGNEARGLAMVERHVPWLSHDALNEAGQLNMLTAIGVVLESVGRAGYGEQVVRGANDPSLDRFFGTRETPWTVAELIPAVWASAATMSAAFDQRNGNDYISSEVARKKAMLDQRYDLPIASEVFLPRETAIQPSTPEQWLALGEIYVYAGLSDAKEPLERALEGANPATKSRALQILTSTLYHIGEVEEAKQTLKARCEALEAEGEHLQAELETRAGLSLYGSTGPEDLAVLEAECARLADTGGAELGDAEITLAGCLMEQEEFDSDRVLQLLESAAVHCTSRPNLKASVLKMLMVQYANNDDNEKMEAAFEEATALDLCDGARASVLTQQARIMGGKQRFEEGAALADAALKIYVNYGASKPQINAAVLASALYQDAGRHEEELARVRFALREAEPLEIDTTGIRYRLGRALLATSHPHEAVEILWEVLQDEEKMEVPAASRAETCEVLAQGFEAAEKYGNAVSMYGRAADLLVEGEQPVMAANMLRRKANILREFEIYDDALEALSQAWDLVQNNDAPGMEVQVLEAWAFTKSNTGDASALDDIRRAITTVENDPDGPFTWKVADLIDSQGRVLMGLERRDEAVACFLQAGDGYAEAGDFVSAARAEHFAAQNLAGPLERIEEAVPIWADSLAHADQATAQGQDAAGLLESILVKYAEALESLGRNGEAAELRSRMSQG